jgi:hypothetical protein
MDWTVIGWQAETFISGSPGMNVGRDLLLRLKAPVLQGFRGSGGLLGDAHVW